MTRPETLTTLPAYTMPVIPDGELPPRWNEGDLARWSGANPPPAIGDKVTILTNGIGAATVTGYFVARGWLGIITILLDAPQWHREQNDGNPEALIFGAEIAP